MTQIIRRWIPLGLWLTACTAALAALWSVEEPRFDLPPANPDTWSRWVSGRESLDAAAGVSRLLATLALSYLLVVSVAHLLALAWGPAGLCRLTRRLSPGPVAALAATAVLGGSPLAAAMGTPAGLTADGDGSGEIPAPVMRVIEDDTSPTTTTVPVTTIPSPRTTDPSPDTTAPTTAPTTTPQPAPPGAAEDATSMDYAVGAGENLWVIAEQQVRLNLGHEATEAEIRDYWLALMDLNAPRMVEPGNPNLLLPGQVLRLPR